MLLASAFVNIYFISISNIISSALYIFKASPHPCFHWMVTMNQLLPVSLALAWNPDPLFDLSPISLVQL
jgi:hypothetical protein